MKVFWVVGLLFILGCGTGKGVRENDTSSNSSDSVVTKLEISEIGASKMVYKGIVKDESIRGSSCGFLIEYVSFGNTVWFQPDFMDHKFMKDGLEVTFTYTKSRRPVTCDGTVPIILDTIE